MGFNCAPKKLIQIVLAFIGVAFTLTTTIRAQSNRANHWAFPRGNGINFNTGSPQPYLTAVPAFGTLTMNTSTMSGENGQLLFYSNGEKCWNRNHQVMPNGNGLLGNQETTQSSIIVPAPENPDRYYLFTMDDNGYGDGLNYYVVDMSLAGGLGDVVTSAIPLSDTMCEKLVAVKHANDYDYWVVTHRWLSDEFLAFKVDSFGVSSTPVVSSVGLSHSGASNNVMGQMKISPDGTRLAAAVLASGHIQLFDFDASTGEVSNPLTLENYATNFPFGVEFSPDSRKLYYTQRFSDDPPAKIIQYDLENLHTDCLLDSKYTVAQINFLKVPSNLQLGRDGRIYMGMNYYTTNDTLCVIEYPNEKGAACGFEEFGFNTDSNLVEGLTSLVTSYLSDGIHLVFGTNCEGLSTEFYPEDSLGLDSVRWNFADPSTGSLNTSTSKEATHVFSSPDTFFVTLITYQGTSSDTFGRNIVIWDLAENLLGADTTICNASPVTLDATWYDACLEWSTGSSLSSISVSSGGWYWVDVHHQSCLFRDSIYVEGVSGPPQFTLGNDTAICNNGDFYIDPHLPYAFYTWQDGSHDTTMHVVGTGTYSLTATNACGSSSDTIHVTLNITAQPSLNFPNDTVACDTSDFTLDVQFTNATYLWNDGTTQGIKTITLPGIYWVRVSNVCDTVADTINVSFDSPILSAMKDAYVHCGEDDTLTLASTLEGDTVLWMSTLFASEFDVTAPGTFWFESENGCGSISDTAQVMAWDTSYSFSLGPDTTLCLPDELIAIGDDTNGFLFEYQWSTGESTPSISVGAGLFSANVKNRCYTYSDDILVSIAKPVTIVKPSERALCEGEKVLLALASQGVQSAIWSTGDSTTSISANEATVYEVEATDGFGCVHSDSIIFYDRCPPLVFIPNVLTPNEDLVNDGFCIRTKNIRHLRVEIFNRWGIEVYASDEKDACWEGSLNGNALANGVYFYVVTAEGTNGEQITHQGSLTLMR